MDTDSITALQRFLEYGPIGLAGLTLILAVAAIMTRDLNDNQTSLLRLVLLIGFASLLSLLVAEFMRVDDRHDMRVAVWPLDQDSDQNSFPDPLVKVDEAEIDRSMPFEVSDDFTVTVDVSRAIDAVRKALAETDRAVAETTEANAQLEEMLNRLSEIEASLDTTKSTSGVEGLRIANDVSESLRELSISVERQTD